MTIAVDFDGTIVEHRYPDIGREIPFACATLRQLIADGHKLILWTVREGRLLQDALDYCRARGVEFFAVNSNYPDEPAKPLDGCSCRKLNAELYIDDRNVGALPDWGVIYRLITDRQTYDDYLRTLSAPPRKPSLLSRLLHRSNS